MKIRYKACKRCGGDLVPDRWDRYGRTLTCLQCGSDVQTESPSGDDALLRSLNIGYAPEAGDAPALAIGGRQW